MRKKPNFFIVGAPKCGTTSLANWLGQHEHVFMPAEKEPHHFYSQLGSRMPIGQYLELFSSVGPMHRAIGEASVWYLFSEVAIDRILAFHPDPKFIVCIRNPVDMAQSLHNQKLVTGHELVDNFEEAWLLNDRREAGEPVGVFDCDGADYSHMAYKKACKIGSQLTRLYEKVDAEKIHIVVLDDLVATPEKEYQKVCRFLDLEKQSDIDFSPRNQAGQHRSQSFHRFMMKLSFVRDTLGIPKGSGRLAWLHKLNFRSRKNEALSVEFSSDLYRAFESEVQILEQRLDRSFIEWTRDCKV